MTQKLHNDLSLNALFNEAKSQNVDVPDISDIGGC